MFGITKNIYICYSFFVSIIHLLQFFVSVRYYKNCYNFFFRICITFVIIFVSIRIQIFLTNDSVLQFCSY